MSTVDILNRWYEAIMVSMPGIIAAILILIIGWIAGRLLGKGIRIALDRLSEITTLDRSSFASEVKRKGITIGYIGDCAVRCFVYLVALLAAVDVLGLNYLSTLMSSIVVYIPHIVAFIVIIIAGIILTDYFIDFLGRYAEAEKIEMITPVLFLLRIFLYFVVVMFGLSQLLLDLSVIYLFLTPIAWGVGIGLGASIAIVVWHGMKDRSAPLMEAVMQLLSKEH